MATQVTLNSGSVDSAGSLALKTNGTTTAITISTGQVATLEKDAVVNGLTVGRGAGAVSTNTAVGASALAANTSGVASTVVGYQAGQSITTANSLTAVGRGAFKNTTASNNTGVGDEAGVATTTGASNVAIGPLAFYSNTTGSYNIAIGQQALRANTTASNNTAVGYQAGYTNTTGTGSNYVGRQAGYSSNANYNTMMGDQAGYSSTGIGNTFFGYYAGGGATSATYNTFVGYGAGNAITTGGKNTILGCYNGNNVLDIRTASNYIVLSDGDGNPRLFVDNSGFVNCAGAYSNTSAAAANATFNASGYFSRSTSALKYKQDIRDLESMDIGLLRPVRYKSKCEGDDQTKDHLGIVADEAADAGFEELVTRGIDNEVEGFQYERLTVVLLKAIQELKAELDTAKAQIAALQGA